MSKYKLHAKCLEFCHGNTLSYDWIDEAATLLAKQFNQYDLACIIDNDTFNETFKYFKEMLIHCVKERLGTVLMTKYHFENAMEKPRIAAVTVTLDLKNYIQLLNIENSSDNIKDDAIGVEFDHFVWQSSINSINCKEYSQLNDIINSELKTGSSASSSANTKGNENLFRYGLYRAVDSDFMRLGIMSLHNYMEYVPFVEHYKYNYFLAQTINEMSFKLTQSMFPNSVLVLSKIYYKNVIKNMINKGVFDESYFVKHIENNDKACKFLKKHPCCYMVAYRVQDGLPKNLNQLKTVAQKYYFKNGFTQTSEKNVILPKSSSDQDCIQIIKTSKL